MASDQDLVQAKMFDDFLRRVLNIHHHKIGMGVDGHEHPYHGRIEEFLAIVGIAFDEVRYSLGVAQSQADNLSPIAFKLS